MQIFTTEKGKAFI